MIRSMSDGQMQAKYGYDKEPWVDRNGERYVDPKFAMAVILDFVPRPECIPSRDPEPFVLGNTVDRSSLAHVGPYRLRFKPRPWGTFIPDPKFVRSEVNPILSAFRSRTANSNPRSWLTALNTWLRFPDVTIEQVDDAHRVLERLAAVIAA